jgi:phosphoribosylformylglycinamidine synthase
MRPKVLVLRAPGINCDQETVTAWEMAGARAEVIHINALLRGEKRLANYQILTLPGGFSYGDDLGAAKLLAVVLSYRLVEPLQAFMAAHKPIIGICNGFQALVKTRMLANATLYFNDCGHFTCRWVHLQVPAPNRCIWTRGLSHIYLPVAHGEGKFVPRDAATLGQLAVNGQVTLRYARGENPNGSAGDIAGICDETGLVFGLMPHPERYVVPWQHPRWSHGEASTKGDGLAIFRNAVEYVNSG